MQIKKFNLVIIPLFNIMYIILSFFITIRSYFKNSDAICKKNKIIMPPITAKENFVESVIWLSHFSIKFFLLLVCSQIKPCFIAIFGIIVGIYSKIGGILLFSIYVFVCGVENLGDDFYLILFFVFLGIVCTYLNKTCK